MAALIQESQLEPVYIAGSHLPSSAIILDNTKARLALDWQPLTTLSEGIRQATLRILPQRVPQLVPMERLQPQTVLTTSEVTLTHA